MTIQQKETNLQNWPAEKKSDLIHNYVMRYADRNARKIDYGTGVRYTSVEMHVLEKICDNPGITVTELSKLSYRTKGAISQIVTRLQTKGLVDKKSVDTGILRQIALLPTKKGLELNALHVEYDRRNTEEFYETVEKYCSHAEIDAFFKVMETCFHLLSPDADYPWNDTELTKRNK